MTETQKKIGSVAVTVAAVVVLVVVVWRSFGKETVPADTRTVMDSETGELFRVPTKDIKPYPMTNPKTGTKTLHTTEICLWGEECRKRGGTRVILNSRLQKPEPTHCPVCGHVVRFHNPAPPDFYAGGAPAHGKAGSKGGAEGHGGD